MARGKSKGLLTRVELAAALDVNPRTIAKWIEEGLPVAKRGKGGSPSQFDLAACRAWQAARAQLQADDPIDLMRERARKERAQALLAEQLYAVRSGKLLPADEVEKVWTAEVAAVRSLMLSAPQTWSDRIYRASTSEGLAGVERELKALIHSFMRELADRRTPKPRKKKAAA